ncbi:hypothetical protein BpHYR1_036950 [Brachionus plicatilis]|uniref:Uncharacterized protein n=1 Tax=Brachionus plicatilis TaxID=10195 RepID=A0A3M7S913_BRAPC|nr:hypothetical protein BpHYR1_036950 [Brachionus plicatilis]
MIKRTRLHSYITFIHSRREKYIPYFTKQELFLKLFEFKQIFNGFFQICLASFYLYADSTKKDEMSPYFARKKSKKCALVKSMNMIIEVNPDFN